MKLVHLHTSVKPVFFIVGDGERKEFVDDQVNELTKLGVDIRSTSWIKDIASFNAGMDIICLTSKNEGTPVSIIEAQASEVAVISTNVGGVSNVLINNESGYIVPSDNARIFAEKLIFLIDNESLRMEMGKKGWEYVRNKFHYERLVTEMEEYYKKLLLQKA